MKEFYLQGDEEKKRRLSISPLCDSADMAGVPKSQLGFLNFLVKPLFEIYLTYLELKVTKHDPNVKETTRVFKENMNRNELFWKR